MIEWNRRPDEGVLAERLAELRADLREREPRVLAYRAGALFREEGPVQGEFLLALWGRQVALTYPDFIARDVDSGEKLDAASQALLAYYFQLSDGTPRSGVWIAFSELPEGRFYSRAFQGYTGDELKKAFGDDLQAFERACVRLHGRPESLGDRAFSFRVLPKLAIAVTCWLGDEDFPTSYRVLFDASAGHHLSTDACAVVGSTIVRRLLKVHS